MKKQNKSLKKKAFSLVELAIVVVVLGVLITGITKVKSLIALSETRAVEITANPYKPDASIPVTEGLHVWFSASNGESMLDDAGEVISGDGSPISTWKDLSGNDTDAGILTTDGSLYGDNAGTTYTDDVPLYSKSGMNGEPSVAFDGSSVLMFDASTLKSKTEVTSIFVVKSLEPIAGGVNSFLSLFTHQVNTFSVYFGKFLSASAFSALSTTVTTGVPVIYGQKRTKDSATNATSELYVNGILEDSKTRTYPVDNYEFVDEGGVWFYSNTVAREDGNNNFSNNKAVIGANYGSVWGAPAPNNSPHAYIGEISEIIIYDRALSDEELNYVNGYLGKKYNIAVGEL